MSAACPPAPRAPQTQIWARDGAAVPGWRLGEHIPEPGSACSPFPSVPPPSISGRVSRLAVKVAFLGLLGYGLYWMGRRTASLVLSLPATQYCLQRASSARPHK